MIMFYDGFPESQHSLWSDELGGQLAVVFTPIFYPTVLAKKRFLMGINRIPTTEFLVRVFGGMVSVGSSDAGQ